MTTPFLSLQDAEGGPITPEVVAAVLADEFSVGFGSPAVVRRTDLDTFDRRLGAAGFSLRHLSDSAGQRLVLIHPDAAAPLTTRIANVRWPALTTDLPAGAVRDALAPLVTIRALMVLDDHQDHRVRRGELRNEDQKIVARLELDEHTTGATATPARLSVHALRGYGSEARRAVRLLSAAGLRPVRQARRERTRGGIRTRLDRSAPATALLRAEWTDHLATMRANLPGLLDDVDTEFLHDFRVAVRRTRSTLKLGRPALPDGATDRWASEFKWLGDLTTPVRDLDVHELSVPVMARWLVAADPAHLRPFALHLRRRRSTARRGLVRGLRSARFRRLLSGWEDALADLGSSGQQPALTAGELADRGIGRAYRRVIRDGAAIHPGSPAEALHRLRKRCKELRYALDLFTPVTDGAARKRAVSDLKDVQDILGRFQDADVQRHALLGFAEEMRAARAPTESLLAMGELVAILDVDQQRARDGFDRAFARLNRPSGRRRMRQLTVSR